MKIGPSFWTTSYGAKRMNTAFGFGNRVEAGQQEKPKSMREQMREIAKSSQQSNATQGNGPKQFKGGLASSVINSTVSYGDVIRQQRLKNSDTSNQLKKMKYQFKNLSSKIIQSKTSVSARKVASAAKREIIKLKKELNSDKYDKEEIEAAIAHAKAMERVAKKKARHLEEEEMVRTGGICAERLEEEEKRLQNPEEEIDEESEEELDAEYAEEDGTYASEEAWEYEQAGNFAAFSGGTSDYGMNDLTLQVVELYESVSNTMEQLEEAWSGIEEMTSDMMEEMNEGMKDMLEEMGFGDLAESAEAVKKDMDPADLKAMKIKHRNKEMKDIVKADADYLKTIFKHFEEIKSGKASPAAPSGGTSAPGMSQPTTGFSQPAGISISTPSVSGPAPTINITL